MHGTKQKTNYTPKITIIDSGIDLNKIDCKDLVKMNTGFSIIDGYIRENKNKDIENMHGTAIAQVISNFSDNINFLSINVLNQRLKTDFRVLLYALYYTLENLNTNIIHLSLSTANPLHAYYLKDIVKKTVEKDIIIVASVDNNGEKSYPACMEGVVGVKAHDNIQAEEYYCDDKYFFASSKLKSFNNADIDGSSLSAAHMTGHIAKIIHDNGWTGGADIINKLRKRAIRRETG